MLTFRFLFYLLIITSGVVIGIVNFKKITMPFKIIIFFLLATLLSEIVSRILSYLINNSSPTYHFYVLISATVISFMYFKLIKNNRTLIFILYVLFCFFSITNSLFIQKLTTFPTNSIVTSCILFIFYGLLFYKQIIDNGEVSLKQSIILLNVVFLVYFSSQLFNWGLYNYLSNKILNPNIIYTFSYILNLFFYISIVFLLVLEYKNHTKNNE